MRTLVIGLPLPHVSYDNYSFLSAPSFLDYRRLIVLPEAIARTVGEVITGEQEHTTFSAHTVVNGSSTVTSFALADLLAMRARETQWLLDHGGVVVCFASLGITFDAISGLPSWHTYDWLPGPQGFRYAQHLWPGFGRPGAVLCQEDHPFAAYVETFASRIAYRAVLDEEAPQFSQYGRIFIRSHGGAAIGAELQVGRGSVVLLPTLVRFGADRSLLADTLFECLQRHLRVSGSEPQIATRSRENY